MMPFASASSAAPNKFAIFARCKVRWHGIDMRRERYDRRSPSCQHIKALARHCHSLCNAARSRASAAKMRVQILSGSCLGSRRDSMSTRHASMLRIHALFFFLEELLRRRNCAEILRRTPPLDSRSIRRPQDRVTHRFVRTIGYSERAFASFPKPLPFFFRYGRNFGGEKTSCPFRAATEAIGAAARLLLTSAPLQELFYLLDQSPRCKKLRAVIKRQYESFKSLFALPQRRGQSSRTSLARSTSAGSRILPHARGVRPAELFRKRRQILIRQFA